MQWAIQNSDVNMIHARFHDQDFDCHIDCNESTKGI